MGYMQKLGASLIARGYLVVPIAPGQKRPSIKNWQDARLTAAQTQQYNGAGVGFLLGKGDVPLSAWDVDSTCAPLVREFRQWCDERVGGVGLERVGLAPKTLLLYRAARGGYTKRASDWFEDAEPPVGGGGKARHRFEALGAGQQFVGYAIHPGTGEPYKWIDPLGGAASVSPADIPVVDDVAIDEAISAFERLALAHGLIRVRKARAAAPDGAPRAETPKHGMDVAHVAGLLDAQPEGAAEDYDAWVRAGMALHHEYGDTEQEPDALAAWDEWSAQAGNYAGREALEAKWLSFGLRGPGAASVTLGSLMADARNWSEPVVELFDIVPPPGSAGGGDGDGDGPRVSALADLPPMRRNKTGEIEATLSNLDKALRHEALCGTAICYDEFRDEILVAYSDGDGSRKPVTDADAARIRRDLERKGFKPISRELMRDALGMVADDVRIDTARIWLDSLRWDGVPRVAGFMHQYCGVEPGAYTTAVSRYLWSALAGRVIQPGVKVDMALILVGAQGLRKSSAIMAMVPSPDLYAEVSLSANDDDSARLMRGKLVAEFAELKGLANRDIESVKAFITRTHERWVPKFKEFTTSYPRRLVFIGTSNPDDILADDTGNRRWLPVRCVRQLDTDAIAADREQLWAEGAAMFLSEGVAWQDAERLATAEHEQFRKIDAWEGVVGEWLRSAKNCEFLRAEDVLRLALGIEPRDHDTGKLRRIGKILRLYGFIRVRNMIGGEREWRWVQKIAG